MRYYLFKKIVYWVGLVKKDKKEINRDIKAEW